MNPSGQDVRNIRVRLVQVGQTDQAASSTDSGPQNRVVAILRARVAIVIIRRVGQRCKLRGGAPYLMVANDVHHNPYHACDTPSPAAQGRRRAKIGVDLIYVACPVAMVPTVRVVNDRGYPNGIESHAL